MALDLSRIRVILFDLDGTLYDDTHHFDRYAVLIGEGLPEEHRETFLAEYQAVVRGEHPALAVGTFYDVEHDLVLRVKGGKVQEAVHWDGSVAPTLLTRQLYPETIIPDHQTILNVGDLWWVPTAISTHYGGNAEHHEASFLRIREAMMAPEFTINPIKALSETVAGLKGKVVRVLATNSPQPDSEAILTKVGLLPHLDRLFFSSRKPAGLQAIITGLLAEYGIDPSQLLSVGDNLTNEIAPAKALGCQTVFIDPHGIGAGAEADLIIPAMSAFLPSLRELATLA
jgi:FMN phosphatase YigB (HAD superfamily)